LKSRSRHRMAQRACSGLIS